MRPKRKPHPPVQEAPIGAPLISRWERMKKHKVIYWTGLYISIALVVLELAAKYLGGSDPGDTHVVRQWMWGLALAIPFVITFAWYHGDRGIQRFSVPELLILTLLGFIGFGLLRVLRSDGDPQPPAPQPVPATAPARHVVGRLNGKKVVVLAVMSGGDSYEKIILNAFEERARKRVEAEGGKFEWKVPRDGHNISPDHPDGRLQWDRQAENILRLYKDVDYLVSVGTFASVAIKEHDLVSKLGADGQIFLGVTNPVGAGLVEHLNPRSEDAKIAGVRYGNGGEAYGQFIASLFPADQKLVFVRLEDSPQDTYMAAELAQMDRVKPLVYRGQLDAGLLNDPDAVYFGWYGFDSALGDEANGAAMLLDKKVVPSTCTKELLHSAGLVVSVNDEDVGVAGVHLMMNVILNSELKLGHLPVKDVDYSYWVDWDTVLEKKIKLKVARDASNDNDICPDGST